MTRALPLCRECYAYLAVPSFVVADAKCGNESCLSLPTCEWCGGEAIGCKPCRGTGVVHPEDVCAVCNRHGSHDETCPGYTAQCFRESAEDVQRDRLLDHVIATGGV